ncbi:MAG: hypothetical protein C4311_08415 [Chloroflexota bacterium]
MAGSLIREVFGLQKAQKVTDGTKGFPAVLSSVVRHPSSVAVTLMALSLAVTLLAALPVHGPTYMDADYYLLTAQRLYRGFGFIENILWNYLDDPAGLPHPSHVYWMPLPSILAALGLWLFGDSFRAAQFPFILLTAFLPLVSYRLSRALGGEQRHAWAAGLFTVFSGFYLVFWAMPDAFAAYALAGSLSLIALGQGWAGRGRRWFFLAGLGAGFGHLARADGLLLLLTGLGMIAWKSIHRRDAEEAQETRFLRETRFLKCLRLGGEQSFFTISAAGLVLLLGYLLVMAPWFYRNWVAAGAVLPGAGLQTLFLRDYDELFSYGLPLTLERYLDWGLGNILASKLWAARLNLMTFVGPNNLIFLTPFTLIGLWRLRHEPLMRPALVYGVLLYAAMTLAFTFPGVRGGLLHSSVALLPFFFAAAPVGLEATVRWVARRRRGWHVQQAMRVFTAGFIVLAAALSLALTMRTMQGEHWIGGSSEVYRQIGAWLSGQGLEEATVMVNNPPGFALRTGHPAIVVPNGDVDTLLAVADRYGATVLVLDANRPGPLAGLYAGTEAHPRLIRQVELDGAQVYRIVSEAGNGGS